MNEPVDPWTALERIARIARDAIWSIELQRFSMEQIRRIALAPLHERKNFSYPEDDWYVAG